MNSQERDQCRQSGAAPHEEPHVTLPAGGSLGLDEIARARDLFGVDEQQIRRDHAISLVLAELSAHMAGKLYFFGGTALNRTHIPNGRLSEDIDLIATGNRPSIADRVTAAVERALRRAHGRVEWQPGFDRGDGVRPAMAVTSSGVALQIQVLSSLGYPDWPSEYRDVEQHYPDVGPATLRVPTMPAFAAWKTVAWTDRQTSRDLYDLRSLAQGGAFTSEAVDLFVRLGPTGRRPTKRMFETGPRDNWTVSIGAQTRLDFSAGEALQEVRDAWAQALGEDWS